MKLTTTFRGLERAEAASAAAALERNTARLDRLLDLRAKIKAVFEQDGTAKRVTLTLATGRHEFTAQDTDHDLNKAVAASCERIRNQLVKQRGRRESNRYKEVAVSG